MEIEVNMNILQLCPNNNIASDPDQGCFEQHQLQVILEKTPFYRSSHRWLENQHFQSACDITSMFMMTSASLLMTMVSWLIMSSLMSLLMTLTQVGAAGETEQLVREDQVCTVCYSHE